MFVNFFNLSLLLAIVLPLCAFAAPISKRQATGARMTFYNVQDGNEVYCGGYYSNDDAIVALSAQNMNQNLCGKTISLSYQGVTKTATLVDMCEGCPSNGLDLAENFFPDFAPASVGVIYGDWSYTDGTDGGSSSPSSSSSPSPSPSPSPDRAANDASPSSSPTPTPTPSPNSSADDASPSPATPSSSPASSGSTDGSDDPECESDPNA